MATIVVSGRVPAETKLRADAVIRASGSSVASVINDVWATIAETGELPASAQSRQAQDERRQAFASFLTWFEALPPQSDAYAHLSDDEVLALRVDEYV